MPKDQFGRPIHEGDAVIIKGTVASLTDDPNFLNCTVKLNEPQPPGNRETKLQLNTAQLERDMEVSPMPQEQE
jgi:hypothetical protein